jgi:hypothetical protein
VEHDLAQALAQVGGEVVERLTELEAQGVLGHGERDRRAGHLDRVHVAVDPDGRARAIEIASDADQPEVAPFERSADRADPADVGEGGRPAV